MEGGAALGERLLDQIVLARRDAPGEEQEIAGFLRTVEQRSEVVEAVAGDAEARRFAARECHMGGEAIAIGVADLMELGFGVDLDEFVAGREDRDAGARKDVDLGGAHRGDSSDVGCGKACAGRDERIAAVGLASRGDDVAAGAKLQFGLKANFAVRDLDVFEHDHGVRAFRESCAGHDLERGAGFEWFGTRRFTGAEDARDGNPVAGGECSTLDGVAIPGGAMEWREVAVGSDRRGDNALECF
jgi:hypothetical protein